MGKNIHTNSLAWDILRIVGGGAIVLSMLAAPNMGMLLAPFVSRESRGQRERRQEQIQKALQRLRQRRYVIFEQKGNETYIKITEYGKQRLRKFEFDELRLPDQPRRWDKKWRLVIFDIPEEKKKERNIFSGKLKDIGFLALQKSVFVYPHPCEDEVDFLARFLDIDRNVYYFETSSLGNGDLFAGRHFDLL